MPRVQTVPESFQNVPEWCRRLALAVNGLLLGRSNNTRSFTLTPASSTSVMTDARITPDTIALLEPVTANAAADHGSGIYQVAAVGSITFTHPNNANADKTFRVALVG